MTLVSLELVQPLQPTVVVPSAVLLEEVAGRAGADAEVRDRRKLRPVEPGRGVGQLPVRQEAEDLAAQATGADGRVGRRRTDRSPANDQDAGSAGDDIGRVHGRRIDRRRLRAGGRIRRVGCGRWIGDPGLDARDVARCGARHAGVAAGDAAGVAAGGAALGGVAPSRIAWPDSRPAGSARGARPSTRHVSSARGRNGTVTRLARREGDPVVGMGHRFLVLDRRHETAGRGVARCRRERRAGRGDRRQAGQQAGDQDERAPARGAGAAGAAKGDRHEAPQRSAEVRP